MADFQVGLLSPAERAGLEAHVSDCAACRDELAALAATMDLLGQMKPCEAPAATWKHVQARLTPRRQAPSRLRQWTPVFAAALVLLMIGVALLPGLQGPAQPGLPNSDGYAQVQLAAAWDSPLADNAALGLVLIALDSEGAVLEPEVLD